MPTDVTSLHHVRVALARHDRANDGHAGQACDVGDDMIMAGTCMGFWCQAFFVVVGSVFYPFKFLCSVGEPFLCPGLHPGSEPRGAAVNIAVGTAGGGAKRC